MTHYAEAVFGGDCRGFAAYEPPIVQYQGGLDDFIRYLLPNWGNERVGIDPRITKLMHFIDSHDGAVGWDLNHVCRELKLAISSAHAARLFKRCTGLGVREYAKRKRLWLAAKRLKTTDIPIKAIAAEFGYHSLPHFTRRFKDEFRLSPTEFRKGASRPRDVGEGALCGR
jgi:AraC-like DNA-binding protein